MACDQLLCPGDSAQGGQPPNLYLASQSPRRAQLLDQIGVPFEVLGPRDEAERQALEDLERTGPRESARNYAKRVTLLKLGAACERVRASSLPRAPILCADTTVEIGGRIFGKPADAAQAREMLSVLSGNTHQVHTAVAVANATLETAYWSVSSSRVTFDRLTLGARERFIESCQWQGKAGGYSIQGKAAVFTRLIIGSYSSIMGLPLRETSLLLGQVGVECLHSDLE